ncbi:MAG: calcium-binding protein [Rickettsiales bacterium]|nr:calcium-binding protein [Rickettsiales bacterium]
MSVIHTSTRSTLGLSPTAADSVTTAIQNLNIGGGALLPTTITDGTDGNDTFTAPSNTNYVFAFGGDDLIDNTGSNALLFGGAGSDTFIIANNTLLSGFKDGSILDFEVGLDKIDLSAFEIASFSDLTLSPNTSGTLGNFTQISNVTANLTLEVSATSGLDSLTADSFTFSPLTTPAEETTSGGDGTDTTSTGSSTTSTATLPDFVLPTLAAVAAAAGGLTLSGDGLITTLTGGTGGDLLQGAAGAIAETLLGGDGIDNILGGEGTDTLFGGSTRVDPTDSGDFLYGGAGNDTIFGNGGDDILIGGTGLSDLTDGDDSLIGGAGNDTLIGNSGNDTLFGQIGNDTLNGGTGDDIFVFGYSTGQDLVAGFEGAGAVGGDQLHILANLNNSAIDTAAEVIAAASFVDGGAIINLGSGNSITLLGITSLIESDIQIISDLGIPT